MYFSKLTMGDGNYFIIMEQTIHMLFLIELNVESGLAPCFSLDMIVFYDL